MPQKGFPWNEEPVLRRECILDQGNRWDRVFKQGIAGRSWGTEQKIAGLELSKRVVSGQRWAWEKQVGSVCELHAGAKQSEGFGLTTWSSGVSHGMLGGYFPFVYILVFRQGTKRAMDVYKPFMLWAITLPLVFVYCYEPHVLCSQAVFEDRIGSARAIYWIFHFSFNFNFYGASKWRDTWMGNFQTSENTEETQRNGKHTREF